MFGTPCGSRARAVILIGTLAALGAIAPQAFAQTSFTDFTTYTYAVSAGGAGSFADFQVTRTFDQPIVALKLTIVGGRADDIGFVGSRQVTNAPAACSDVGTVTGAQDVSDQVTISGNTASFTLRALENCCCFTGWGSATQGDRADARFQWEVTLGGCQVQPLTPVTDPVALDFEGGNTINTDRLTTRMKDGLACLRSAVTGAGGSFTLNSAYRPPAYQVHLRQVWDGWNRLKNNRTSLCADRRTEMQTEFQRHRLRESQRPASSTGPHTQGEAIDANVTLPPTVNVDTLAFNCNLRRPLIAADPVHFVPR